MSAIANTAAVKSTKAAARVRKPAKKGAEAAAVVSTPVSLVRPERAPKPAPAPEIAPILQLAVSLQKAPKAEPAPVRGAGRMYKPEQVVTLVGEVRGPLAKYCHEKLQKGTFAELCAICADYPQPKGTKLSARKDWGLRTAVYLINKRSLYRISGR